MATSKDFYFKIWKERSKGSACVIANTMPIKGCGFYRGF